MALPMSEVAGSIVVRLRMRLPEDVEAGEAIPRVASMLAECLEEQGYGRIEGWAGEAGNPEECVFSLDVEATEPRPWKREAA